MYRLQRVLSVLFLTMMTLGCDMSTLGMNGVVHFSDETEGPGLGLRSGIYRPIAQNAELRLRLSEGGLEPKHLISENKEIVEVIDTELILDTNTGQPDEDSTRVLLKAGKIGTSKLTVNLDDGKSDYVSLRVERVSHAEIQLFPWDSAIPLNSALWANGLSMLPNANLTMFGRMHAENGQQLTGAKALEWSMSTDGNAELKPNPVSDFVVLSSGSRIGTHTIRFGQSDVQSISTISEDDVSRMEIMFPLHQTTSIPAGETLIMHIGLFTNDGKYVVGIGSQSVQYDTDDGLELGRLVQPSEGTHSEDSSDALNLERAYRVGRAMDLSAAQPGSYTVTARWGRLEATAVIDVVLATELDADIADDDTNPDDAYNDSNP